MRQRLLVISFRPIPVPAAAGYALRMLETARYLARDYDLDLLYLCQQGAPSHEALEREGIFREIYRFEYAPWEFGANLARALASPLPAQVHAYTFAKVRRWLAQRQHGYGAILAHFVRVGEMLRGVSIPVLFDLVDAISLHYERAARMSSGLRRTLYEIEGKRLLQYELDCVRRHPASLMVSECDRDYLIAHGAAADRLVAVPVAIPGDILGRAPYDGPEDDSMVFLGRMAYAPNRDAALFFANEVLPRVMPQAPDCRFVVVGADPPPEIRALARRPGIEVTGTVIDPAPWLERAKVVVAPIRYGAGMQNKVLHALALRRAVVVSSLSAAGLGGRDGEHFLVADDPEDFAEATLRLLGDPALRQRLGAAGRKLVERRFSLDAVGERVASQLDGLLGARPLVRAA